MIEELAFTLVGGVIGFVSGLLSAVLVEGQRECRRRIERDREHVAAAADDVLAWLKGRTFTPTDTFQVMELVTNRTLARVGDPELRRLLRLFGERALTDYKETRGVQSHHEEERWGYAVWREIEKRFATREQECRLVRGWPSRRQIRRQ